MEVQWFRQDKPAVLEALRGGQRPLMATTMASGPLDELLALHIELGIFEALDALPVARQRDGLADALLLRTLATLPFLPEAGSGGRRLTEGGSDDGGLEELVESLPSRSSRSAIRRSNDCTSAVTAA